MKSYQRWIWQLPEWPALAFDAQRIQAALAAARTSQGILLGKAEAIGLEGLQPHIRDSLTQEALTTSAIEGEKLDPESVRSSVARRLGLDTSGAPVREGRRNIEGLIDVLQDATLNTDAPLTLERLCSWHGALFPTGFSGMQRIDVGALRSVPMEIVSGAVGHSKLHYAAPPAEGLAEQMDAFLNWFNQTQPKVGPQPMDGLVRAAVSHLWFETLHPFDDGNGRLGRAILQLALGQDMGQPGRIVTLSRQIESCKDQYYRELERAQRSKSMDVTAWVEWLLAQIDLANEFANRTIDSAIQRIRFQAQMSSVSLNERQHKTMKKLLDAGPKGFEGGMTTRKHERIAQTSTPTAARDLIDLERLGLLTRYGDGRSTRYYPAIEGWAEDDAKLGKASGT
ncbi:Fic family protein [Limnohabitans sp.]|uniref:Fic family protein n=1 Tax=Limnohabitans sp. TaxID=1907725 RepID=UPI0025BDB99A|nr:Fic family protein [Limnohabitans sp.]